MIIIHSRRDQVDHDLVATRHDDNDAAADWNWDWDWVCDDVAALVCCIPK